VAGLFRTLLADAGHPRPDDTAGLVVSWLLGAVVQQDVAADATDPPGRRELQRLVEAGYP
jgi:hypothetical protein